MQNKHRCDSCDSIIDDAEILEAPNPFDTAETIFACPVCKSVNDLIKICDEDGCKQDVTCGFPTSEGYRRTCGKHYRKANSHNEP